MRKREVAGGRDKDNDKDRDADKEDGSRMEGRTRKIKEHERARSAGNGVQKGEKTKRSE